MNPYDQRGQTFRNTETCLATKITFWLRNPTTTTQQVFFNIYNCTTNNLATAVPATQLGLTQWFTLPTNGGAIIGYTLELNNYVSLTNGTIYAVGFSKSVTGVQLDFNYTTGGSAPGALWLADPNSPPELYTQQDCHFQVLALHIV